MSGKFYFCYIGLNYYIDLITGINQSFYLLIFLKRYHILYTRHTLQDLKRSPRLLLNLRIGIIFGIVAFLVADIVSNFGDLSIIFLHFAIYGLDDFAPWCNSRGKTSLSDFFLCLLFLLLFFLFLLFSLFGNGLGFLWGLFDGLNHIVAAKKTFNFLQWILMSFF